MGVCKYFPLWTLQDLQCASVVAGFEALSKETIEKRYRQVGGVPRQIFADNKKFETTLLSQTTALNRLTKDQAMKIAQGKMDSLESLSSNQPKSALLGYKQARSDDVSF